MIHSNIFCLFLILLISSCDVAASIVTEETDVGVAVFVTSVSGSLCHICEWSQV